MNKKEAEKEMHRIVFLGNSDTESDHITADEILCNLLKSLGYRKLIKLYDSIGKWYA